MRSHVIAFVLMLITTAAVSQQDARASDWRIESSVRWLFGETGYCLRVMGEDPGSPGTRTEFRSALEFPLDVTLAGLALHWDPSAGGVGHWAIELGASVGLTEPRSTMTDRDWIGGEQVVYTESDTEATLLLATAGASLGLAKREGVAVSLVGRVDYERISQDITGFDGWVVDVDTGIREHVSGADPAIDYQVTYVMPQFGVRSAVRLGRRSALALTCVAGPVFASDTADHLLRGKSSESDAVGFSVSAGAELSLVPGSMLGGRAGVSLSGDLRYLSAEGEQTQHWYKDDGETPAGTEIGGIPYKFRAFQYSIGVTVAFAL